MRGELWTIERVDLLRRLWSDGQTAAAIALRLGISRSAVMGKVFRLRPRAGQGGDASPPKGGAADDRGGQPSAGPARRRRGGGRKKRPPPQPGARGHHKTLLELTNYSCRWIVEAIVKAAISWAWSHFQ